MHPVQQTRPELLVNCTHNPLVSASLIQGSEELIFDTQDSFVVLQLRFSLQVVKRSRCLLQSFGPAICYEDGCFGLC